MFPLVIDSIGLIPRQLNLWTFIRRSCGGVNLLTQLLGWK